MTLQGMETAAVGGALQNSQSEITDTADVLGMLAELLRQRAVARKAIAQHSRPNSGQLARASWLAEHERAMNHIAQILPDAQLLLSRLAREVAPFGDVDSTRTR